MPPKIDLVIPGLFDQIQAWTESYVEKPSVTTLTSLLQKSDCTQNPATNYEATLWQLFSSQDWKNSELPIGRICSDLSGEVICRADPVHLKPGISDLMLIDQSQLDLAEDEIDLLTTLINGHVNEFGGSFKTINGAGVLAFTEAPALRSTPVSSVAGNGINEFLPENTDKGWWPRLLNEFQMLMFNSELNQLREKRQKPEISGLWLWGGGELSGALLSANYDGCIASNEPFLDSLLERTGTPSQKMTTEQLVISENSRNLLLVYPELLPPSQYDDYFHWQKNLLKLEQNFIKPLSGLLNSGKVFELNLYPCNGSVFTIKPKHRLRFWRKEKPLASYARNL